MPDTKKRRIRTYVLLELGEFLLLIFFLVMISYFIRIPLWVIIAIPAGKFLKFLFVYPIVRRSIKQPLHSGIESLIGMRGLTVEAIDPEGYINARGELWRAVSNDASIPAGAKVEVCGLDKTKLVLRSLE